MEAKIKNREIERLQVITGGRLERKRCVNHLRPLLLLHQRLHSALHHERGVLHPGLGFCGSIVYQSLSMCLIIRSIWAGLHDYGYRCNSFDYCGMK
jgi:hypothetical protein